MAEESQPKDVAVADPPAGEAAGEEDAGRKKKSRKKQGGGIVSRVWKGIFGAREDLEKRLQFLSKEETVVITRMRRRARSSRQTARNVLFLAVVLEIAAVGFAIMTTRSPYLSWQMRAIRVSPMFVLPVLAAFVYSVINRLAAIFEQKDQNTLEKLRAERKAKIDELKERTNYYTTQQLIQKYDLDPAAKAAAATVLASKLGADSGLKVYVGDDSSTSHDVQQPEQTTGLRQRRAVHGNSSTVGSPAAELIDESFGDSCNGAHEMAGQTPRMVEHYKGTRSGDGGWVARLAALLVGEDPSQCYALICGNCHMHNGLARKEDYPFITYYCPHCHALNGSQQPEGHETVSSDQGVPNSAIATPATMVEASPRNSTVSGPVAAETSQLPSTEVKEEVKSS